MTRAVGREMMERLGRVRRSRVRQGQELPTTPVEQVREPGPKRTRQAATGLVKAMLVGLGRTDRVMGQERGQGLGRVPVPVPVQEPAEAKGSVRMGPT